ncbi:MAG TPA: DUF1328 domain-containing protein [Terricaulis sp.]|nr:DUF1328 domain-containing protein [Terricaulis sp.]
MLGWAFAFFVAALIAAVFGFGGIASAFSGLAVLLFWIFVALLVLSLIAGAFTRGHGPAVASSGRTALLIATTAVVAIVAYAWVENDWTAEQAGREVDRAASEFAANTGDAVETAGERTGRFLERTGDEIRADAARGMDEMSETVDPENDEKS